MRAGSIVPIGSAVTGASKDQIVESVRVYPGADAQFTLFSDDGTSYKYEHGADSVTTLRWDDQARKLTYFGGTARFRAARLADHGPLTRLR